LFKNRPRLMANREKFYHSWIKTLNFRFSLKSLKKVMAMYQPFLKKSFKYRLSLCPSKIKFR